MRDTIDMAREAGMESNEYMLYEALAHTAWVCDSGDLERLVALARADEREACAKVCDELFADVPAYSAPDCAATIRARSKK